ncbi:MAG: Abi family protein [Eubacteriales bacterium]|uniref:Abi family protein n=1 Tax=Fenollaria sp. TaxID=1965292 RepID=UPI002A764805|nr:Abi family protein [Fenollaria sp.]MDD7340330.1 Abi family protein [Eubacteriales bacterium]MDY3105225.1 Abi family protein [Fenollaria sp.]
MKPFKTIDQQIDMLKDRGLLIDLKSTKEILFKEGYYNIINGYKDIFLSDTYEEKFSKGTRFSDIYMLYHFDNLLRDNILNACISIESIIKTVISYYISDEYGICESVYLDRSKYRTGRVITTTNGRKYEIDAVIDNLKHLKNSNDEPFKHYKDKHGHIPAWVLLKGANFWTVKTFFKLLNKDMKSAITAKLLDKNIDYITEDDKQFLSDLIQIIYKFRNCAAHGGRMYNLNIKTRKVSSSIKYYKPFHDQMNVSSSQYSLGYGQSDFYAFYFAVKELLPNNEYQVFNGTIINLLKIIKERYNHRYILILRKMGVPEHMLDIPEEAIFK